MVAELGVLMGITQTKSYFPAIAAIHHESLASLTHNAPPELTRRNHRMPLGYEFIILALKASSAKARYVLSVALVELPVRVALSAKNVKSMQH